MDVGTAMGQGAEARAVAVGRMAPAVAASFRRLVNSVSPASLANCRRGRRLKAAAVAL